MTTGMVWKPMLGAAGVRELRKGKTFAEIKQLAQDFGVAPGIAAGQLCHRFDEWQRLSRLRPALTP